jgi:hypothetical protein
MGIPPVSRLSHEQLARLKSLLLYYMKNRHSARTGGPNDETHCPYDGNTVGIAHAFKDDLPIFPNSVPEWESSTPEERNAMFEKTVLALQ